MTRQLKCSECGRIVPSKLPASTSLTRCPACGAQLRLNPGPSKPDGKKRKKRQKETRAILGGPWVWVPIAGGFSFVLVAGIVLAVLFGRGGAVGGNKPDDGAPDIALSVDPSGRFVIINSPVEPLQSVAAPRVGKKRASVAQRKPEPPAARSVPPAKQPAGAWHAQPDPSTTSPPAISSELALNFTGPPLFAALGGPFVIDVPLSNARFVPSPSRGGRGRPINVNTEPPPIPVLDLRTGKAVGEFSWKAPAWLGGCLSPDGMYLVGADTAPGFKATENDGQVLVWKRDAKEPVARISPTKAVSWTDFVSNERLAMLALTPSPVLQVWDVVKGQAVQTIPLKAEDFPSSFVPPFKAVPSKLTYSPYPFHGAVSPGGRYIALGGKRGIVLVSLADGRTVGELPLSDDLDRLNYRGLSFHPDGSEMFALVGSHGRCRLRSWSLEDGSSQIGATLMDELFCGPPLPGPEPGTVILPLRSPIKRGIDPSQWQRLPHYPGAVVESTTGGVLLDLESLVARWAAPGRLLMYGAPGVAAGRVRTVALDGKTLRDWAGPTLTALASRPPARPGDRSALKRLRPSPEAWSVRIPDDPTALAAAGPLPDWPVAFGDTEAALIATETLMKPVRRVEVRWQRYDLRTGRPLGQPIVLWPWATRQGEPVDGFVAALTADGKRLALRDPADSARVDIWDNTGTRLLGLNAGVKSPIDWLGWSGDGRLLTLVAGILTCWEIPAVRAVYEVDGGYTGQPTWGPGRRWLALAAEHHMDFVDTASGQCQGRCQAEGIAEEANLWAISPDRRLLIRTCRGDLVEPKDAQYGSRVAVRIWDLTTGKETASVQFGQAPARAIRWCGPRQFLVLSNSWDLIDVDARAAVCRYQFPKRQAPSPDRQADVLRSDAAGRLWGIVLDRIDRKPRASPGAGVWQPLAIPDPKGTAGVLARPERGYAFHPGATVQVEVDLGDQDRSRKAAQTVAALLQREGFILGTGGWRLRLSQEEVSIDGRLPRFDGDKDGPHLACFRATWRLLTSEGTQAWKSEDQRVFNLVRSKYVTERKTAGPAGGGQFYERIKYDFRGQDPHQAMLAEVLDQFAAEEHLPRNMPLVLLRDGDRYVSLPLQDELRLAVAP